MAEDPKDTIYIDVEDEITTVIDKVLASNKKLVALVLPKRASVFQSIVNMKLLKRKADQAKKNLVLVTAEEGLLPLAGAVGIHVAKNLSSKPEIPAAPVINEAMVEADEDESIPVAAGASGVAAAAEAEELKDAANEEIANKEPKATPPKDSKGVETINLDNSDNADKPTDTAMPAAAIAAAEAKKKAKNKKLKVPNFNRFRLLAVLIGVGIIVLIVLFILLFKVFPHATIDIKTNAQNVDANVSLNLSTTATKVSTSSGTIPSKQVTETKTYTATTNATGQQNNGQTATGQVTFTVNNCVKGTSPTIPAGTGVTSNNLTYITQSTVMLCQGGGFYNGTTNVTAQNPGSNYNTSGSATFTANVSGQTYTGTGSASGGSDDNVTIVSQTDINTAENKITPDTSGAKTDLTNQLTQANYYPIGATFSGAAPSISPNASAGTAASSVTVTETIKYTMYGVIKSDLTQLLDSNITSQAGSNQNILSNGLSNASYSIGSSPTNITLITTAVVGPNINVNNLKNEVVGQKTGAIESLVKSDPDVSSVTVKLSPFYVSKAPGISHITINVAKPTNSPTNASSN